MATEQQLNLIGNAYRAIAAMYPSFRARPQQQAMMRRASRLLMPIEDDANSIGLIDAPTGTGKSLGYLLPGLVAAITDDKRLVLSTATASLQDQLAVKDVPLVLKALEQLEITGVKFAVAKGRERHLCPLKLHGKTENQGLFDNEDQKVFGEVQDELESGWDGLKDTLKTTLSNNQWRQINNTAASCSAQRCPMVAECPYYVSMEACKNARLVIVNHDYLLTTMARVQNSFLAKSNENIYVFDEAHHLGDKILSSFAHSLDLGDTMEDELRKCLDILKGRSGTPLSIAAERMRGLWLASMNSVDRLLGDSTLHRFTLGEIPPALAGLLRELGLAIKDFIEEMGNASKALDTSNSTVAALAEAIIGQLKGEYGKAQQCLECFVDEEQVYARWLQRGKKSIELRCSPFDAADLARRHLWPNIKRGLLASATLTTLGNFDNVRRSLGLPKEVSTLKLDSPFDYSRSKVVVPKYATDGSSSSHSSMVFAHLTEYAIRTEQLGVLVYFTSKQLMKQCYESLSSEDREMVLMQGDMQTWAMVEEHKKRIDAGKKSVLFGMDSISEGVDLPGNYCTRVIVTKLPFPSMNDPVLATHAEHLKKKGIEPFNVVILPKAGQKLAQIAGRLVRTDGDHGDILILDQRMRQRTYGRSLLSGTPYRQIEDTAHV